MRFNTHLSSRVELLQNISAFERKKEEKLKTMKFEEYAKKTQSRSKLPA